MDDLTGLGYPASMCGLMCGLRMGLWTGMARQLGLWGGRDTEPIGR